MGLLSGLFKSKDEKASEYFKKGSACSENGDYNGAINYFVKAGELFIKLENVRGISASFYNIGNAFKKLKQWKNAYDNYKSASEGYASLGEDEDLGDCYFYMGFCISEENDTEALSCYEKAIPLYAKCESYLDLANTYYNAGNSARRLGRLNAALDYYGQARQLYVRLGRNDDIADCDKQIAKLR